MLVTTVALELFKVQRPHRIKCTFIFSRADLLHPLAKCLNDTWSVSSIELWISFESVEISTAESSLHRYLKFMLTGCILSRVGITLCVILLLKAVLKYNS